MPGFNRSTHACIQQRCARTRSPARSAPAASGSLAPLQRPTTTATVRRDPANPGFRTPGEPVPEDIGAGYGFAIKTTSVAVLGLFQQRCLKSNPASKCQFKMP